jgi:hypothetical protein
VGVVDKWAHLIIDGLSSLFIYHALFMDSRDVPVHGAAAIELTGPIYGIDS